MSCCAAATTTSASLAADGDAPRLPNRPAAQSHCLDVSTKSAGAGISAMPFAVLLGSVFTLKIENVLRSAPERGNPGSS
jgi:hypothetical protein